MRSISAVVISWKFSNTSPVAGLMDWIGCSYRPPYLRANPSAQFLREPQVFTIVDRAGHHRRDSLIKRLLKNRQKLLSSGDFIAAATEGFRQRGKIRVAEVYEGRPSVALQLFPFDNAVTRILEDQRNKAGARPHRRLQFLGAHKKSPVTARRQHAPVGIEELGADRAWESNTHAGKAIGDDAGIRGSTLIHAGDPEFMSADIADEDIVVSEHLSQDADHALRFQRKGVVLSLRAELLLDYFSQRAGTPDRARVAARRAALGNPQQRFGDRTLNTHGHLIGSIHLSWRGIDVHDALVPPCVPACRRVLHEIVTRADDHIGAIEPAGCVVLLLETDGPQTQRVRVRKASFA